MRRKPAPDTTFMATYQEGIVNELDEIKHKVKVRFPHLDNLISDWLPVLTQHSLKNKFYCLPDIGEHVVCMLDANGEQGVVLGAIFNDKDMPPSEINTVDKHHIEYEDGTWIQYDRKAHKLKIFCVGEIEMYPQPINLPPVK